MDEFFANELFSFLRDSRRSVFLVLPEMGIVLIYQIGKLK